MFSIHQLNILECIKVAMFNVYIYVPIIHTVCNMQLAAACEMHCRCKPAVLGHGPFLLKK